MGLDISVKDYVEYLKNVMIKLVENKDYVTGLDSATGDGDHWVNMYVGFQKVIENADFFEEMTFSSMFREIARMMMNSIGGSSGILYGSGYLSASKIVGDVKRIDEHQLLLILEAMKEGIIHRGNCKPGDKTMLDTLHVANLAFGRSLIDGSDIRSALNALKNGAIKGMNMTRDMEAAKGRAYYQKDKGIGHLDPGAVTMCYQLEVLAETLLKKM